MLPVLHFKIIQMFSGCLYSRILISRLSSRLSILEDMLYITFPFCQSPSTDDQSTNIWEESLDGNDAVKIQLMIHIRYM